MPSQKQTLFKKSIALLLFISSLIISSSHQDILAQEKSLQAHQKTTQEQAIQLDERGLIVWNKKKQILLGELDTQQRATGAHIQLREADKPKNKRESKQSYTPAGWHNYRFYFEDGKKKAWLMNRGHLIGYLFSGLNDEPTNIVPITAWLNAGSYKGVDSNNQDAMLFYEKGLDSWLHDHPDHWLDYKVTPIYQEDELIPRQVHLQYVGIDKKGNLLTIDLGEKDVQDEWGISHVTLDNISPNAELDYQTGIATNTVLSAKKQEEARLAAEAEAKRIAEEEAAREAEARRIAEEQARLEAEANRPVYIARNGTAEVYWYNTDSMPRNTRFDRVVQMTEAEAKALGKRHSSKE